jgi:hypothetical protein
MVTTITTVAVANFALSSPLMHLMWESTSIQFLYRSVSNGAEIF